MTQPKKIPVILDTDIGNDIDDTWALAMLLNSPELDVKLIVTDTGDTAYRAKVTAKFLQRAGRSDIPVGVGFVEPFDGPPDHQMAWVKDYDLRDYPGTVYTDGVQAMIDTILASSELVTLICIGPVPNLGEALRRCPQIASNAHFVGMFGSIHKEHMGRVGAIAEYNVCKAIRACQAAFTAPWKSITITPLDTCGFVQLAGERYTRLLASRSPMVQDVLENYRLWHASSRSPHDPANRSSILYDTVAVHLAYTTRYLKMETLGVRVTDDGFTVIDPNAQPMHVAIDWLNYEGYCDELTERVLR